jgi:hypothetical protein
MTEANPAHVGPAVSQIARHLWKRLSLAFGRKPFSTPRARINHTLPDDTVTHPWLDVRFPSAARSQSKNVVDRLIDGDVVQLDEAGGGGGYMFSLFVPRIPKVVWEELLTMSKGIKLGLDELADVSQPPPQGIVLLLFDGTPIAFWIPQRLMDAVGRRMLNRN